MTKSIKLFWIANSFECFWFARRNQQPIREAHAKCIQILAHCASLSRNAAVGDVRIAFRRRPLTTNTLLRANVCWTHCVLFATAELAVCAPFARDETLAVFYSHLFWSSGSFWYVYNCLHTTLWCHHNHRLICFKRFVVKLDYLQHCLIPFGSYFGFGARSLSQMKISTWKLQVTRPHLSEAHLKTCHIVASTRFVLIKCKNQVWFPIIHF